jgi:hypothetical protein
MMGGNHELIKSIRDVIQKGGEVDPKMRDLLLFSAIADIYESLERFEPVMMFYKAGMFFASAIGISVLAFIGALLTGQIEVAFK